LVALLILSACVSIGAAQKEDSSSSAVNNNDVAVRMQDGDKAAEKVAKEEQKAEEKQDKKQNKQIEKSGDVTRPLDGAVPGKSLMYDGDRNRVAILDFTASGTKATVALGLAGYPEYMPLIEGDAYAHSIKVDILLGDNIIGSAAEENPAMFGGYYVIDVPLDREISASEAENCKAVLSVDGVPEYQYMLTGNRDFCFDENGNAEISSFYMLSSTGIDHLEFRLKDAKDLGPLGYSFKVARISVLETDSEGRSIGPLAASNYCILYFDAKGACVYDGFIPFYRRIDITSSDIEILVRKAY
jgi:hypothetical protein